MNFIETKSFAKINIGLNIVEKRSDGFHNLETILYPVYDLFDILTFEKSDSFEFISDNKLIGNNSDNLIIKAKEKLEEVSGKKLNVKINLKKLIPVGSGLGGGSSNCAATLVSLNQLFELGITYDQMMEFALELGSDVPFFLRGKPAIGKSRGEELSFINFLITNPILIVNPNIHISTEEAFQDINPKKSDIDYNEIFAGDNFDWDDVKNKVRNDFEESIFAKHPEIKKIKNHFYSSDALFASMSGSGSTVYGIFKDIPSAINAKEKFPKSYFKFISHYR